MYNQLWTSMFRPIDAQKTTGRPLFCINFWSWPFDRYGIIFNFHDVASISSKLWRESRKHLSQHLPVRIYVWWGKKWKILFSDQLQLEWAWFISCVIWIQYGSIFMSGKLWISILMFMTRNTKYRSLHFTESIFKTREM